MAIMNEHEKKMFEIELFFMGAKELTLGIENETMFNDPFLRESYLFLKSHQVELYLNDIHINALQKKSHGTNDNIKRIQSSWLESRN